LDEWIDGLIDARFSLLDHAHNLWLLAHSLSSEERKPKANRGRVSESDF
jgi:hypothetical protein